ncbi:MAG: prolipoprotein diacylglyceryl transferase [Planctomycetota bacterium]
MLQVLLQIPTNLTVPFFGQQIPVLGFGILLGAWLLLCAFWGIQHFRRHGFNADLQSQVVFQALIALVIWKLPVITDFIKIYGYGAAMVCGFLAAAWLAGERAKREGLDPAIMWDIGMTVLFSGVIGARLFYIIKNPANFFGGGRTLVQTLIEIVNLSNGGLVLYGGVLLGIAAFIWHSRRLGLSALKLADILIPAIFVGEMFGRIGCFLNGCCFGDPTTLPWAVQFPAGSVPFMMEVQAGVIKENAMCSLPLHPAQIYSSINALILAIITWNYYPRRSRDGSVLLLGWVLYPITRFCLEIVRGDTPGEFGTSLTIAQWVSFAMLFGAAGFAVFLSTRPKLPPVSPELPQTPPQK